MSGAVLLLRTSPCGSRLFPSRIIVKPRSARSARGPHPADPSARSIEHYEAPGKLSKIPTDESKIPPELRIPRLTSAVWKYENGAVGSFTHAVALQGHAYACELEVWADGYHMRLVDPYQAPTLYVRRPGDDHEERHVYTDDDPFFSEVSSFVDCIEGGPDPHILSSFEDATKTYEWVPGAVPR